MYLELRTETLEEHAERVGEDETSTESQWCDGCASFVAMGVECGHSAAALVQPEIVRVVLVCSCGFRTCPLIHRYGLTPPTFEGEIQPIPSQVTRDRQALAIKAEGRL